MFGRCLLLLGFFSTASTYCCHFGSIFADGAPVTAEKPTKTICGMNQFQFGLYIPFAVKHYSANFSDINWEHEFVTISPPMGWSTIPNMMQWWVVNGSAKCDAFIGTSWTGQAQALSYLMTSKVAWVDPGSTGDILSVKENFPHFSRVIVPDSIGATMPISVMTSLGWKLVNVIVADTTFGVSYQQAFVKAWRAPGSGRAVDLMRVVPGETTTGTFEPVVTDLLAARSRVVLLAGLDPDNTRDLVAVLRARGVYTEFTLFVPENHCRGTFDAPGSLCVAASHDTDHPFKTAFMAQPDNEAEATKALALAAGITAEEWMDGFPAKPAWDMWMALYHDATLHAMTAIAKHLADSSEAPISQYLRNVSIMGATGDTSMDPATGDRIAMAAVALNIGSDGTVNEIARVTNYNEKTQIVAPVYTRGSIYGVGATFPADAKPLEKDHTLMIAIATGAGALLLVVSVAVAGVCFMSTRGRKNSKYAPKSEAHPFAMVFTDIQSSTALWARHPDMMGEALDAHNSILRHLVWQTRGYEVKTIGDSFMVAFRDVCDALQFAVEAQVALHEHNWGANGLYLNDTVNEVVATNYPEWYAAQRKSASPPPPGGAVDEISYAAAFAGLRVRIGIGFGTGDIKKDPETGAFDYFGTVVNTAARVEAVAHGGQTCATQAAVKAAEAAGWSASGSGVVVTDLGAQPLRGLDDAVHLFQLVPAGVPPRRFPPLRLDMEVADMIADGEDNDRLTACEAGVRDSGASMGTNMTGCPALTDVLGELIFKVAMAQFPRSCHRHIAALQRQMGGEVSAMTPDLEETPTAGIGVFPSPRPPRTSCNLRVETDAGVTQNLVSLAKPATGAEYSSDAGVPSGRVLPPSANVIATHSGCSDPDVLVGVPVRSDAALGADMVDVAGVGIPTARSGGSFSAADVAEHSSMAALSPQHVMLDAAVHTSGVHLGTAAVSSAVSSSVPPNRERKSFPGPPGCGVGMVGMTHGSLPPVSGGIPTACLPLAQDSIGIVHATIKALLAPSKPAERKRMLTSMAAAWRIPTRGPGGDSWRPVRHARRFFPDNQDDFTSVIIAGKVLSTLYANQVTGIGGVSVAPGSARKSLALGGNTAGPVNVSPRPKSLLSTNGSRNSTTLPELV